MSTATDPTITEAIEQARNGDTGAFARIVRQYQSLVSGVLFSATGDFHKSEDFTQETFLIAWRKLHELRDTENIAAWLCTIARNLAYRSHRNKVVSTAHGSLEGELKSSEPGPDTEMLRREQSEMVWSAIGEIEEKYRETLVLYYRSGKSVREIAAAMDSTEDAVNQRLVRARKSLKVRLEQMIGDVLNDTAPGELFTLSVMTALGAAMVSNTAQAAVTAATGTTAAATVGTGSATGGKALGAATIWTVLAPVAYAAWFLSMFIGFFWAAVRNAPTLRARRFRVYSIFWSLQYYSLGVAAFTIVGSAVFMLAWGLFKFNPAVNPFFILFPIVFLILIPIQAAYHRKLKGIIENDIGLPGPRIESYTYPQVERRFFLTLITNILLFETLLGFFVCLFWTDGSGSTPEFPLVVSIAVGVAVLLGTVYYLLGRYFLEICRTKENFLAASPLIDKPLDAALLKPGVSPISVDHPIRAGSMSGFLLLTWIGAAAFGVWYFSLYSWDKHPIALGLCAALTFGVFCVQPIFARKAGNQKDVFFSSVLLALFLPAMIVALEFIEFGGLSSLFEFGIKPGFRDPRSMIHHLNFTWLFMGGFFFLIFLGKWFKAKREETGEQESGRDAQVREAIARFKPEELVDDEPIAEAKPFPKRWIRILGLYGAAIVVLWCLGVLIPNPFVSQRTLERNNDYTELIKREPSNPEWYFKRGNIYSSPLGGRNIEKAIEDYNTAIRLKPDYAEAYQQRAQAESFIQTPVNKITLDEIEQRNLEIKEKNLRALADADKAIRLNPKKWEFYNSRAYIRSVSGDLDGAEADYTKAIELKPSSVRYATRGGFYDFSRKEHRKSIADYTTAIRLAEQEKAKTGYAGFPLFVLYQYRADQYDKLGEPDKAKADREKAELYQ